MSKAELQEKARELGLDDSGTVAELQERIEAASQDEPQPVDGASEVDEAVGRNQYGQETATYRYGGYRAEVDPSRGASGSVSLAAADWVGPNPFEFPKDDIPVVIELLKAIR